MSSNVREVTIASPQHAGGRINHWLVQEGFYDETTMIFTPMVGGHKVHFHKPEQIWEAEKKAMQLSISGKVISENKTDNSVTYEP